MAVETSKSGLIKALNVLFYWSAFNGLIPYSIPAYYKQKIFQVTILSNVWVIFAVVHDITQYHFSSFFFSLGDKADSGIKILIFGLRIFI